jgi:SAM-dependent methyltransferase
MVVWHDVECGAYQADLPLWRELAGAARGPVLELGCGSGRVALDLASRGHEVTALDSEPVLVGALASRGRARGLRIETVVADARSFELPKREFALIVAPMQVAQLMGGAGGRDDLLACARAHLRTGGVLALALADPLEGVPAEEADPPLPDVREEDGWVFSSLPIGVHSEQGGIRIDRLRQTVSPQGELEETLASIRLDTVTPDELESAAASLGMRVLDRRTVEPVRDYVGSVVVVLEKP